MAFTQLLQQQARMFNKPADYSDVCEKFKDIDAYVNRNRTCYEGQLIYVKESETLYIVKKDKNLKGTMVVGKDANSTTYKNTTGLYYTEAGATKLNQLILGADVQVNLGAGNSLGGADDGYIFDDSMTFEEVLKKLVQKQIHPTYIKPTCSLNMSSNPSPLVSNNSAKIYTYEIGQKIIPTFTVNFVKNNAGNLNSIKLYKQIGSGSKTQVDVKTDGLHSATFILPVEILNGTEIKFIAEASYEDGGYLQDNFGDDDPTGSIKAGTIVSNTITIKSVRKAFWEFRDSAFSPSNSQEVRNGDKLVSSGPRQGGSFVLQSNEINDLQITVVAGVRCVFFAYPANIKDLTYIKASAQSNNNILGNFVKTSVMVYGDNDLNLTEYKVYTYTPNTAWGNNDILTISTK